jgi:hypothetical protein
MQSAAIMEKITFGDNIPGYVYGPEDAPGVVMLQVRPLAHVTTKESIADGT